MAPKQIEKRPLVSSSDEEEEESASSGEESGSSDDEGNEQSKPTQTSVATKKPDSDSDSDGESDSDSDPEPAKKQPPVVAKPKAESSKSAVTVPESSKAKRPLEKALDEAKKKMKISTAEHVKKPAKEEEVKKISGEEAKKMFQRLFSEADEIALLKGILDFNGDISEDMDGFCNYVKKLITFDATKSQIATKIQRLKKKYLNIVKKSLKKGKGEDEITFSKDLDQKGFDLSRTIWGSNGVLASKSRKKAPKEVKVAPKEVKGSQKAPKAQPPKKQAETEIKTTSREMARFFKADNVGVLGLDERTITEDWDMVPDGPKKREMEARFRKLKATEAELCLERIGIVNKAARMILKGNE